MLKSLERRFTLYVCILICRCVSFTASVTAPDAISDTSPAMLFWRLLLNKIFRVILLMLIYLDM